MMDSLERGQPAEEMDTGYVEDKLEYEHFAPSCKKIPKDENLELSNPSFKDDIQVNEQFDDDIPLFPAPQIFAHFSKIAYDDEPKINSDLAPGWQVLTTATNTNKQHIAIQATKAVFRWATGTGKNKTAPSNGYFGVAFWHPDNHHLVIAHRGTIPSCIGALETDYYGVIHNEYVWQIFSAATFALEVVQAFRNKKVEFQLFFTGHSLGGWLAQITTFTIKYLHLTETWSAGTLISCFHRLPGKNIDSEKSTSVHAHTVVFDSPGCKEMLLKLADGFDVRYSGKIVQVNELDITSFMSAPNWVNTRNAHLGTIYRLCFNITKVVPVESIGKSWLNSFGKFIELYKKLEYTEAAHKMTNFLEAFVTELAGKAEETGNFESGQKLKKCGSAKKYKSRENIVIYEVIDWPESNGLSGGKEFDEFLKWASGENIIFHPLEHSYSTTLPGCYTIRYQVKIPEKGKKSSNVFTQSEKDFLEQYQLVRTFRDQNELSELSEKHQDVLAEYKISNLHIHSSEIGKINRLAASVSLILRKHKNLPKQIQEKLTSAGVATFEYLKSINQNDYRFNTNLEIVNTILQSDGQIWELTAENSTAAFIRFVDTLRKEILHRSSSSSSFDTVWRYTTLSYKKLMKLTNDDTVLPQEFNEGRHVVVINCGHVDNGQKRRLDELKTQLAQSDKTNVKLILISSSNTNWVGNDHKFISSWEWKDLSTDTKRRLMGKTIVLQGKCVVLSNILFNMGRSENLSEEDLNSDIEFILSESDIIRLMASDSVTLTVGGHPLRISELEAAFVKCGNSILDKDSVLNFIKRCTDENTAFNFSIGNPSPSSSLVENIELNKHKVYTKQLRFLGRNFFEENEQNFKQFCRKSKLQMAYWFSIIKDEWKLEMIFDANFFINRNIDRVAVKQFVRKNISEFKFLNFSSTAIRSSLEVTNKELPDETLQTQIISGNLSFDKTDCTDDVDAIPANILMFSEAFPEEFVLYEKPSEDNLSVFRGKSIFLLVDEPGMGKSTTLVRLGEAEYESHWVIHISLKNCNFKRTTGQNLQTFLWSHGCGNENDLLEKALFDFRLQHIKRVEKPFLFLLDGYDEIQSTESQSEVTILLQELTKKIVNTNHQMIVTTRRHPKLEEKLEVPFTLQFVGFDTLQQEAYLRNAWERRGQLLVKAWNKVKSEKFISNLLDKAGDVLSRQGTKFISIPLQLRLMSVAFFKNYVNYLASQNNAETDILKDITLGELYKDFVTAKYEIYRNEKIACCMNEEQHRRDENAWEDGHRNLAINVIGCGEEFKDSNEGLNELYRIGLVIKTNNKPGSFIHQSFAEYFFAADICDKIVKSQLDAKCSRELLMDILLNSGFQLIRVFLDNLLEIHWNGEAFPELVDEEKAKLDEDCMSTGITVACTENLANILKLIFILRGKNLPTSITLEKGLLTTRIYYDYRRINICPELSPLQIATIHGSVTVVKYLVTEVGVNCTKDDKVSRSALDLAVNRGHLEIAKFLLAQNGYVHDRSKYETPLHTAASIGNLEMVKELVTHEAFDVETENIYKETPLLHAVFYGHLEVVKFLIEEKNANISVRDMHGQTLIHKVHPHCSVDVLKYILTENASRQSTNKPRIDINARSNQGKTGMHCATSVKRIDCLRVLLEQDSSGVDIQDRLGETALHLAATCRSLEGVRCLFEYGAEANILNKKGHTALDSLLTKLAKDSFNSVRCLACYWRREEVVEILSTLKEKTVRITEKVCLKKSKLCANCEEISASMRELFPENVVVKE